MEILYHTYGLRKRPDSAKATHSTVMFLLLNFQDKEYLIQKLGLPIYNIELKANVRPGTPTQEVAKEWFKDLSRRQVLELFKLYQSDFKLFGYKLEPYLSLAKIVNEGNKYQEKNELQT